MCYEYGVVHDRLPVIANQEIAKYTEVHYAAKYLSVNCKHFYYKSITTIPGVPTIKSRSTTPK